MPGGAPRFEEPGTPCQVSDCGYCGRMAGIELHSSAFHDHGPIPHRHAKDGENLSPPLNWSGVPEEASELALLCEDRDAPSGSFVHWLVTGIDPHIDGLEAGETRMRNCGWR
jgi:phosphatidylethanolamine-binding protein (PEBP) family uncharacterized protein